MSVAEIHELTAVEGGVDAQASPEVLHVIDNLGHGGAQRLLITLASPDGVRIRFRVAALKQRNNSIADELRKLGVSVDIIGSNRLRSIGSWIALYNFLRRSPETIVHLHLLAATLMAAPLAWLLGKKVVITLHNVAGEHRNRSLGWLLEALETQCLRRFASKVIAVGKSVHDTNRFRADPARITTIPNAVPSAEVLPDGRREEVRRSLGASASDIVILTAGRLSIQKDHISLLAAFAQVAEGCPAARLWVAGDGSLREKLEHVSATLAIDNKTRFLGHRTDVPALLASADIFVLSSAWEGLPLTLIEAMAQGLPCVATRVGEVEAVVGGAGIVVEPKDPQQLAEKMLVLCRDQELRERLSVSAKRAALAYTNVAAWKARLLQVYRSLA